MNVKLSTLLIAIFILAASCGSSKSSAIETPKVDPVLGIWNMLITGTPNGDIESKVLIAKNAENAYSGEITSSLGQIYLANVNIVDTALTSTFVYEGMDFELKGNFTEKEFTGEVIGMGSTFSASGTKAVE